MSGFYARFITTSKLILKISLVLWSKEKEKKIKTFSTSLHHGDRNARNQPMPKVDPTTVIVEDYMNQSHQNVPAFSHMASRFPDQFHPVASDYGTPQIIEPIPGMHYFQNESSGYANNMVSLPNELQTVVGKFETPPAMVKPIHGMPSFRNELSGSANNMFHFPNESQAVVGNYGTPPQMIGPILGMPPFPDESSGYVHSKFPANELGQYQKDCDTNMLNGN